MINKRYNINKKQYIELNEGERFCSKCDGSGRVRNRKYGLPIITLKCDKCLGDGKIDWIEEVIGKKTKQT